MEKCVRSSPLTRDWPTSVIPNALDTERFRRHEKRFARQVFGLPAERPLVLFGAASGVGDRNKGYDLLMAALDKLRLDGGQRIECVVVGGGGRTVPEYCSVHAVGRVYDDYTMALLYSAVDVTIVPSRIENLPQMATEAQACGCPVIGFRTAGLPDAVADKITGVLVDPFDTEQLAEAMRSMLREEVRAKMGVMAIERAARLWSYSIVAEQYRHIYEEVVKKVAERNCAMTPE